MPSPQSNKIEKELEKIKKLLASDKRKWGVYDDSRGLRYLSPGLYIKNRDWTGGLKYLKWFEKNFPDDAGLPEFLFEWTVILLRNNKLKEAEKKILKTFFSNTYLLDSFFSNEVQQVDKWEGSNLESISYMQFFQYRYDDPAFSDIAEWLDEWMSKDQFIRIRDKYIMLCKKLDQEKDKEIRGYLLAQIIQLKQEGMGNE